ncbi:branched-chain amino acid ABC transporter substrate-binding protein [Amphibiibacter pelophylacis]|uniref:Branched-chain amino acid ABC transporter substrate-binding protein n=1 Tax=Amphibiibacter pelophylacis TaxID=1799477 RepID=A0ACC6P2U3_9BURK
MLKMLPVAFAAALLLAACSKQEAPQAEAPAAAAAPAADAAKPADAPVADAKPADAAPAAAAGGELVVQIGHVAPTSGAIAHLGKDNENGGRLAVEDLNAENFMIGDKRAKFELVPEDDAADPKQATAVAQLLVDKKVNGVVGHLNSGTTIPASAIYAKAGIPQITPSSTNPQYTRQGYKTAFRAVADDVKLGGTLGKYTVDTLKGKTVVVIDDRTAYGQGLADEYTKALEAAGVKPADRQFTNDKATDFTAILTAIKAKKPDVVFFGGMDAVGGPMLRQMKQLGITAKFVGGDGLCTGELYKLSGQSFGDNQVYCAEAGGADGEYKTKMDDFKKRFKEKFGVEVQIYAPYVYDSVMMLANAMKEAGSSDPAVYLPKLAATTGYKGVTGEFSFDEKGDNKNASMTLYTYKGGKREVLEILH